MAERIRRVAGARPVDTGVARISPDPDRPRAFTLTLDDTPQSHVDLDDPTDLDFEYVRRLAFALDLAAPAGRPMRVLHLGGGALTLPRYLAVTRPGSTQRIVEVDAALVDLVRRELPWPKSYGLRVRVGDARDVVTGTPDAAYDAIVADVFSGARTPAHLTSVEFLGQAARILRPGGWYLANLADGRPLDFGRSQVATLRAVLPEVALIADAGVLRGRRYGNLVLVGARTPLPVADLARRAAGDWFPSRVLSGADLDRFVAGAAPVTDATARPSPPPPPFSFGAGMPPD